MSAHSAEPALIDQFALSREIVVSAGLWTSNCDSSVLVLRQLAVEEERAGVMDRDLFASALSTATWCRRAASYDSSSCGPLTRTRLQHFASTLGDVSIEVSCRKR